MEDWMPKKYSYITVDVFTDRAFADNPLAVVTDASGLTPEQMLAIAAEFNYSESTFVLPPDEPGSGSAALQLDDSQLYSRTEGKGERPGTETNPALECTSLRQFESHCAPCRATSCAAFSPR
jgi:hypothetical protein